MRADSKQRRWSLLLAAAVACGCAAPAGVQTGGDRSSKVQNRPSPYSIQRCLLDVALEPAAHRIEATATLTLARRPGAAATGEKLRFLLHRDLLIDAVTCNGSPIPWRRLPQTEKAPEEDGADSDSEEPPSPAEYELDWRPAGKRPDTLVVRYGGRLFQDVQAGEKPGEIHNFQMTAHIGEEGVYLEEDGAWYPRVPEAEDDESDREIALTQFELTVTQVPGMVLVASGNRDGAESDAPRGRRVTWRSPFPLQGMALVGGPHEVFHRRVGDVLLSVHVSQEHASFAPGILDAVESYLDLYQPLIGPYPYDEFTVVENFFSSGFAFPGFTLLASEVIAMGPMSLQPGYLDHEMLHNWWGNGLFVSAKDGNWCECLTSYCANYMRHVLEGHEEKARKQRRDICYGLSRLPADKDKPLARFGRKNGPGRFIGYQKGSMVFAMLAEKIGTDTLWRSLRSLFEERLGKPTGWKDIQAVVEQESGQSLDPFFDTWVRGSGVPEIILDDATYDAKARRLMVTLLQKGDRTFDITVPIRLVFDDGTMDESIAVNQAAQVAVVRSLRPPKRVELDPDFRVMRRVPLRDVMPTISGISKSKSLTIVRAEDDAGAYDAVADRLKERYKKAEDTEVREIEASALEARTFEQGHVLLLGKACLTRPVQEVLKNRPLSFGDGCFFVGQRRYDRPGHEVLCCLRNSRDEGAVICLYYGNSAGNLRKSNVITFYGGNSLIVFEDGRAILRQDFENIQHVIVQRE